MLCVVIRQNAYYPTGTFLVRDDEGYQKVKVVRTARGWQVTHPYGMFIKANKEIDDAVAEIHADGTLDPALKAHILATLPPGFAG